MHKRKKGMRLLFSYERVSGFIGHLNKNKKVTTYSPDIVFPLHNLDAIKLENGKKERKKETMMPN